MTLYLKYRPQTIADLDLKSVRESLMKTLSKPEIPHAFLFAGPKGTGKTSAARIVAKALNCESRITDIEPCNECATCISITRGESLDCLEIDAASHRGIDDIRILRDAVKLSPVSSKYKVYIIDEAHMLTTEASNALLKMLEEPPAHVVFILATTNPEKLIDTIRSRTTLIQFTKATEEDVVARLVKVAKGEKVKVEEKVLSLIAHAADGAFRDAVKIFEQILAEQIELTQDSVNEFLFSNKSFDPGGFITLLAKKDAQKALHLIEHGIQNGVSTKTMAKGILDQLRKQMMENITNGSGGVIELLDLFSKAYAEIPVSYLEQLPLEIAVVKWCGENKQEKEDPPLHIPKVETAPAEKQIGVGLSDTSKVDTVIPDGVFTETMWLTVLGLIRPKNASTETLLRACKPMVFDGKTLTVGVFYKFHKERLESHPHRDLLEEVLAELVKSPVRISCMLTEPPAKKIQEEVLHNNNVVLTETKNNDTIIGAAKDIFGA